MSGLLTNEDPRTRLLREHRERCDQTIAALVKEAGYTRAARQRCVDQAAAALAELEAGVIADSLELSRLRLVHGELEAKAARYAQTSVEIEKSIAFERGRRNSTNAVDEILREAGEERKRANWWVRSRELSKAKSRLDTARSRLGAAEQAHRQHLAQVDQAPPRSAEHEAAESMAKEAKAVVAQHAQNVRDLEVELGNLEAS